MLGALECDRIAGIPYAALPIGTAVSLASGVPLIYNRKESKRHGLGKNIEGLWQPGERVVIIEDVITTGGSIVSSVELFRASGLVVEDAVVLLDRQQGGVQKPYVKSASASTVFWRWTRCWLSWQRAATFPQQFVRSSRILAHLAAHRLIPEQNGE